MRQRPEKRRQHREEMGDPGNFRILTTRAWRAVSPPVRDQGSLGTCWAFASLTALESSLLPEEQPGVFSRPYDAAQQLFLVSRMQEESTAWLWHSLLAWQGPVLESQDPYGDGISPDGLTPYKHVQEIQILPKKIILPLSAPSTLPAGFRALCIPI